MNARNEKTYYYQHIYLKYGPMLLRFAEKFVSELFAEDIVQDVFLKLWDKQIFILPEVADLPLAVSGQLAMWLVPLVWLGTLSLVYFFASGWRAWAWLTGANVLALGLWWLARQGGAA